MKRKEVVLAYFKILSQHLPRGTKENVISLNQDKRAPDRKWNQAPDACVLPTCSVLHRLQTTISVGHTQTCYVTN